MPVIAALIVAGGSGIRAGSGVPKQYRALAGKPMLRRAVEPFRASAQVGRIQVVIGSEHAAACGAALAGLEMAAPVYGGRTRQESVRRGLDALADVRPDFVLIHDGARPLVTRDLIHRVIDSLVLGAEAVVPAVPVSDSLKRFDESNDWAAVSREGIYRAQTPQGFRFDAIRAAHRRFADEDVTDDIALAELAGMKVVDVAGDASNIKITTRTDFDMAERLLSGAMETRTGYGFDVHRFMPGDHVWLCGVRVGHDRALEGHSDADAGLHALTDAILGAVSAGDIGQHFPPSDEKWRGQPSRVFLDHARNLVRDAGGAIVHCDVTLICERPKIGPYRERMRESIAAILGIDLARVNVKATTSEGLGFTGRGEGLAAQAVATIRLPA